MGESSVKADVLKYAILACIMILAFSSRLFAVIRFESIIHEFDPWFNYRATQTMVRDGFYDFLNWFDVRAWYPLGRIVGGTVYPGLMITSGFIHFIMDSIHMPIHIRDVCVFLAPLFSTLTALATYKLTSELWDDRAGLLAAAFIGIAPGYISRSVAGSYDNEGIAIFALVFTYWLWLRAMRTGSILWACGTAISYFYMVAAWGGYVFIINLIPLHVFVLWLMGRYSDRLYTSYSTFFVLGTLMSMQVPFVGFQPIRTSEHMAAMGVFGLLQATMLTNLLRQQFSNDKSFRTFYRVVLAAVAVILFVALLVATWAGFVAPWSGRFYSLWDTGYAKIHIPIIASVSEHQPTTWTSFFFDLHVLVCFFPVGLYLCVRNLNEQRVFIVLYACFASYFAGVMVRLMLTLTPVVCVLAAIAISEILRNNLTPTSPQSLQQQDSADTTTATTTTTTVAAAESAKDSKPKRPPARPATPPRELQLFVSLFMLLLLLYFAIHCTWVTSNAYSSPSVVLASYRPDGSKNILDDFREAYQWLRYNTDEDARVMSWWDYGYQIAGMSNRTTMVDNNTWNNTHIAMVGKAMSSDESAAYKVMRRLDVDYILIIFGGLIGYSGDDINKFLWMVRIAEGEFPQEIQESNYFNERGQFAVDHSVSKTLANSLMYKMSYYRFGEVRTDYNSPPGYDRSRNVEVGRKDIKLKYIEEAYTTEHWLVRIYKVKPPTTVTKALKSKRRDTKRKGTKPIRRGKGAKGFIKKKVIRKRVGKKDKTAKKSKK